MAWEEVGAKKLFYIKWLGVKKIFPHPNELLIWVYPVNLVKIGLLVHELGRGGGLSIFQ